MSEGLEKGSKIHCIVRIRQMIRRWRNKARASLTYRSVPKGHVAVFVGSRCTRFIMRATYLNHPIFQKLLEKAEDEYGFPNQGPLRIPCEESVFHEAIRFISRYESGKPVKHANGDDFLKYCHSAWIESRPLLNDNFGEKDFW